MDPKENQKNESTVLSGNSLEAFFTEDAKPDKQEIPKEEQNSGIEEIFDKKEDKNTFEDFQGTSDNIFEKTPKPEEQLKPAEQPSSYYYDNVVRDFIEEGDWEDMLVETEVDGEMVERPLSELENVDKETFNQIRSEIKRLKDEDFKEKYISVEGLDETTKKMVELKRKGGDITSLIETEAKVVHPLKNIDLEDESVHEGLVRQKLSYQGIKSDVIERTISDYKKNLTLDKEAQEIISEINTNFDKYVEAESKKQLEEIEEQKAQQKEFRKTMSETIKGLDIKEEKVVKSLLDAATKPDETGLSDVDKAFFEAKQNPELFAKVAFLLTDSELFDKHMGVKIKNNANLESMKKVFSLKKRSNSSGAKIEKKEEGLGAFFEKQ